MQIVLVFCPSCVPDKADVNQKYVNEISYSHQNY